MGRIDAATSLLRLRCRALTDLKVPRALRSRAAAARALFLVGSASSSESNGSIFILTFTLVIDICLLLLSVSVLSLARGCWVSFVKHPVQLLLVDRASG